MTSAIVDAPKSFLNWIPPVLGGLLEAVPSTVIHQEPRGNCPIVMGVPVYQSCRVVVAQVEKDS